MQICYHKLPRLQILQMVLENYGFLVYMYYMHPSYQTYIFGKNRAYYIQIFMVEPELSQQRAADPCQSTSTAN